MTVATLLPPNFALIPLENTSIWMTFLVAMTMINGQLNSLLATWEIRFQVKKWPISSILSTFLSLQVCRGTPQLIFVISSKSFQTNMFAENAGRWFRIFDTVSDLSEHCLQKVQRGGPSQLAVQYQYWILVENFNHVTPAAHWKVSPGIIYDVSKGEKLEYFVARTRITGKVTSQCSGCSIRPRQTIPAV